ncbi:MAG: FISUMP domain-containing protein [Ignavibacteria bacterium]
MIKKLLLLFLMVLPVNSHARELSKLRISGKAERMPGELIDRDVRDINGEVCAGIIVITDLTGFAYASGNNIVKINSTTPGKDFIFLSPGERFLEIFCTGFEPMKIILNKYGIRLNSGEVWQIKVTGDKKPDVFPINIITEPKGAEVFIDSISKGTGTTFETSTGEHFLRIELKGYKILETKIAVSIKNILFNYKLSAIEQEIVEIRSSPNDATIYLDGISEGITDNQIFRFPGNYKLRLTKSGYFDVEKEIEVKEDTVNRFLFALVKNTSTLKLDITPSGAEVEINNKNYGNAGEIELAPGSHQLVIRKPGYREVKKIITIELNQPVTETITLEPVTGSLQVKVTPIEAEVNLLKNGKVIENWKGAGTIRDLIIGSYELEAQLDGYEKCTKRIELTEGTTTMKEMILKESGIMIPPDSGCDSQITYANKIYNIVKTGSQCWLKENLDTGIMIDGKQDAVNNGKIEKYCYDNDPDNCAKYGGLYQWNEAMAYSTIPGTKGICPDGWHIPTKAEYQTLKATVEDDGNALKADRQGIENGAGTNTSGFSALLAGYRYYNGFFSSLAGYTSYWSSTDYNTTDAYYMYLYNNDSSTSMYNYNKNYGFSIRCLKDN